MCVAYTLITINLLHLAESDVFQSVGLNPLIKSFFSLYTVYPRLIQCDLRYLIPFL